MTGVIQERLQTHTYGPAQERFPELTFLQGAQGLACFLVGAVLLSLGKLTGAIPTDSTALSAPSTKNDSAAAKKGIYPAIDEYLKCAVSNTIGPACGILALRNISYPAQARNCTHDVLHHFRNIFQSIFFSLFSHILIFSVTRRCPSES